MGYSVNAMDFSKTFESVVHDILVMESMLCNTNKEHVEWIKSCPPDSFQNHSHQWSMGNADSLLNSCILMLGSYYKDQHWASTVQHFWYWESVTGK